MRYTISNIFADVGQIEVVFETGHRVCLGVPFDSDGRVIAGAELDAHVLAYAPTEAQLREEALLQVGLKNFSAITPGETRVAQPLPVAPLSDEEFLAQLTETIRRTAAEAIDNAYPQWRQLNLQSDSNYAQNAISGLTGLTGEESMLRAVSLVGMTDDVATLKALRAGAGELDITAVMEDIPSRLTAAGFSAEAQSDLLLLIDKYFRRLVLGICGYRLIRAVRDWSDMREVKALQLTSRQDMEVFSPSYGCPDIA